MTPNYSKKYMHNNIVDFSYLKLFYIITRCRKEISPIKVI